ncbi:MAG: WYL domain-containing protein [Bacteroidales bacterium]|nr:WYL domain-containing protein [Bacteroidales bacterium]
MTGTLSLKQLVLDVWILEQLQEAGHPGLALEELQLRWASNSNHTGVLSRATMTRHRKMIEEFFGVVIASPDKKHYRIMNPEQLQLDSLANDLLASVQEYLFLDEYRELGAAIQPAQIWAGLCYLRPIGEALHHHYRLKVRYQKFTDVEPYYAVLEPYCLKADKGRWYLLAHKIESAHSEVDVQVFALDRTLSLEVLKETFIPNQDVDPATYFRDCFGIWRDYEHFPVQDITIECTEHVAHYLRTLPLHHSQVEIKADHSHESRCLFKFHISPSPDFICELNKWGNECVMLKSEGKIENWNK